jgi:signal transduction histidine kinase
LLQNQLPILTKKRLLVKSTQKACSIRKICLFVEKFLKKFTNQPIIEIMKLKTKFLSILCLLAIGIGCITYFVSLSNIHQLTRQQAFSYVETIEKKFENLRQQDVQMLSLGMSFFLANKDIQDVFLTRDRELLYQKASPLFEKIKASYGVTHFNFISPDGKVFLRLQDKNTFDDRLQRQSFLDAEANKQIGSNLELGKNSFALRIVAPYYQDNTLIGYVELAREISNFLDTLKYETGDEFVMYGKKRYLNPDDFALSMQKKGLPNSWNNLPEDVLLGTTDTQNTMEECLQENSLANLIQKNSAYREVVRGNQTFLCTGFPVTNSRGDYIATVITAHDITPIITTNQKAFFIELVIIVLVFIIFIAVFYLLLSRFVIRPVQELTFASAAVASGDLEQKVHYASSDEIGELTAFFNVMVEKIKETELAKDNFISLVSHQLRTPLSSIKWLIELLLDPKTGRLNAKQKKFLVATYASSNRLTLLINDILNINRIDMKKIQLVSVPTNIVTLTKNIIAEMTPQFQEKSLTVTTRFARKIPLVKTDPLLLRQVITNIFSNAIKYTPDHGAIKFYIQPTASGLRIEITDTGIGIPKTEQKQIFERFFRASNVTANYTSGTGLGLFIAKLVIKKLGGKIGFRSKLNEGTMVWLTLPARKNKA